MVYWSISGSSSLKCPSMRAFNFTTCAEHNSVATGSVTKKEKHVDERLPKWVSTHKTNVS